MISPIISAAVTAVAEAYPSMTARQLFIASMPSAMAATLSAIPSGTASADQDADDAQKKMAIVSIFHMESSF